MEDDEEEGFDLRRWRKECEADLQKVSKDAATPRRREGASNASPRRRLPEISTRDKLDISEAIFHARISHHVCRGNMESVMAVRASCSVLSAREKLRHWSEVGNVQRSMAAEWRNQKAKPAGRSSSSSWASRSSPTSPTSPTSPMNGNASRSGGSPKAAEVLKGWQNQEDTDFDPESILEEAKPKIVLSGVKAAIRKRIEERTVLAKVAKDRKVKMLPLPEAAREARQAAFNLYADSSGAIVAAENLFRCLIQLNLAGSGEHEKLAVEKLCTSLYSVLLQQQSAVDVSSLDMQSEQALKEAGSLEVAKRAAGERASSPSGIWSVSSTAIKRIPVLFEDFCTEIIPAVRKQLLEMREEQKTMRTPQFPHDGMSTER